MQAAVAAKALDMASLELNVFSTLNSFTESLQDRFWVKFCEVSHVESACINCPWIELLLGNYILSLPTSTFAKWD